MLGEALPRALSRAAAERVRLRHSLPRDCFDYMGCMYRVEGEEEEQGEGLVEADEMGHLGEPQDSGWWMGGAWGGATQGLVCGQWGGR